MFLCIILHSHSQSEATQLLNVSSWRLAAATISQRGQIKSVPNVIYLKAGKTFRMYQRRGPPSTVYHHQINPKHVCYSISIIISFNFLILFIRVDIYPFHGTLEPALEMSHLVVLRKVEVFSTLIPLQCCSASGCRAETRGAEVQGAASSASLSLLVLRKKSIT